ncbi:MAG: tripartite tricarboxylate transporter permease [Rhodospirillaceae bacterium]|nr:tripartite tricarboxylate transporter permease [Rhodospirillaceae bacterium]
MLDMAVKAAVTLADPLRLGFLGLGVIIGLILGVIPGLGGLVGLSLLLPFTFSMDPYTALAFLMGLSAVSATSDTIPAVLFGVPGTVASAATILDGFPMARKGEAGRAFGAAFTASVMGGLFGAVLLGVSIPVLRPIMLAIASPELLAICLFGLSLAAVLAGGSPLKGLVAVCLGLIIAAVGEDTSGELRWTFESLYLYDGFPIVPIALGLFAIPEIADMVIQRSAIQQSGEIAEVTRRSQWQGIKDVFKHWFLVLRCSFIGAGLGAVPGIGAPILDWVAYGHAARTEKGAAETFGKGDVRGVIASESSNNAKEGGSLVPTIAFGVPGTASMALILGAFVIHGLVPGPDMLSKNLDVTYTLVWSVAIANILGAGICFMFANQFAKVAMVRIGILAPIILAVIYLGAFQGKHAWGDIYTLLAFGCVGFAMKRLRWPRPPLILGFVLGELIERYMFISANVYGWSWLTRPITMIIIAITLYGLLRPILRYYFSKERRGKERVPFKLTFQISKLNTDLFLTLGVMVLFALAVSGATEWDEMRSRIMPQSIGTGGIVFAGLLLFVHVFVSPEYIAAIKGRTVRDKVQHQDDAAIDEVEVQHFDLTTDFGDLTVNDIRLRGFAYFAWCIGFLVSAMVIGLMPAMFIFIVSYIRWHGKESWTMALSVAVPLWLLAYMLFHQVLHVPWPQSVLGDTFSILRTFPDFNFF